MWTASLSRSTEVCILESHQLDKNYKCALADYATYFVETNTGNTVSIEVNKDLPDDVLDKVAITLDIVASKSNEKATSTAVINLPRKVVPSTFYFDSGVYTGTYNEDDTFALDSDQKISLTGDIDHSATFAANGGLSC